MIETDIQERSTFMDTTVPPHWRVYRKETRIIHPKAKRIIPIGGGDNRFRSILLEALQEAKETIMLCSFILSDEEIINEILNAAKRKVRCYLLFSTEVQLRKEYYNTDITEFNKKTLASHKKMLDQMVGKALARTNEHLHAKYLLVDYGTPDQNGYLCTANFTYDALTRNQEVGIILKKREIKELFEFFRLGFWSESNQELARLNSWDDVKPESLTNLEEFTRIRTTSNSTQGIKKEILKILNHTRGPLIVASYGLEFDHAVVKKLSEEAGIRKITIITRPREKNVAAIKLLSNAGAIIISYDFLHAKFICAPKNNLALIMTANLETRGLDTGYEAGVLLEEPQDINDLLQISTEWITHAFYKWNNGGNVQTLEPGLIAIPKAQNLEETEIIPEYFYPTEEKKPIDLLEMRKLMKTDFVKPRNVSGKIPKVIRFSRKIHIPILPRNAQKIDANEYWRNILSKKELKERKIKKFPIPIYKLKRNVYGIVDSWKQLDKIHNDPSLPQKIKFVTK